MNRLFVLLEHKIKERMGETIMVDKILIERVSSALKLKFSDDELDHFMDEMKGTLMMLESLNELDTENVEGTFYGGTIGTARLRKDEAVKNEDEVKALLENAPTHKDQLIKVPAILDDGEGGA